MAFAIPQHHTPPHFHPAQRSTPAAQRHFIWKTGSGWQRKVCNAVAILDHKAYILWCIPQRLNDNPALPFTKHSSHISTTIGPATSPRSRAPRGVRGPTRLAVHLPSVIAFPALIPAPSPTPPPAAPQRLLRCRAERLLPFLKQLTL